MILIQWKKEKHKSPHRKFIYFLIGRIFFFFFFFFHRREYRLRYVFMGSSMSDGQLDMRFSLRAVSFDKQFLFLRKKKYFICLAVSLETLFRDKAKEWNVKKKWKWACGRDSFSSFYSHILRVMLYNKI